MPSESVASTVSGSNLVQWIKLKSKLTERRHMCYQYINPITRNEMKWTKSVSPEANQTTENGTKLDTVYYL